jgi:hypothetical protein
MAFGADGSNPGRVGAERLEHRLRLLEAADSTVVSGVQHGLADRSVARDLQQGLDEVADVGR